jgi:hypothetical protein
MKIPRYWKQVFRHVEGVSFHDDHFKAKDDNSADIFSWGYSDISQEDAEIQAEARVDQIVKALSSSMSENYYYPLNVLHEDILEELSLVGEGEALVTRNRYFSQVLNTNNMMFVDIDIPTWDIKSAGFWQKLFGKAAQIESANKIEIEKRYNDALTKVENYVVGDPNAGFLVYRTYAGFRLIASHNTFDPVSVETQKIFDALGTDPLYQKLCKAQECFRARLTPKFWRLNNEIGTCPSIKFRLTPSMVVDWTDAHERRVKDFDKWIESYEKQHISYATCLFVKHIGNKKVLKTLEPLIEYHDRLTQSRSGKPLA